MGSSLFFFEVHRSAIGFVVQVTYDVDSIQGSSNKSGTIHTRLGMVPAQGWRAQSREVYQVFFLQPFLPLGAFEFFWCLHLFIDMFDVQLHWLWSDGLYCRYFHLAHAHWREFRPGSTQAASTKKNSSVIWRIPTTWRTGQTHQTTNRTRTLKQPCFAWFPCLILYNFVLYCIGRSKQFIKSDSLQCRPFFSA